ncbi:hypothetical protein V1512DRAFT_247627 [Lipomyces arxii]|uniref:uncharacterized protein n=1 Tax=Lipomyces arxii TaxID=56418 RepID=UPI0034CD1BD5
MPSSTLPIKKPTQRRDRNTSGRRRIDKMPRSRSGCLTCRARHKRCDERAPVCMNCQRLNIKCEGYAAVIRWQDDAVKTAPVRDSYYSSLRYINIHSADYRCFGDEVDRVIDSFSPYDVFVDSNDSFEQPMDCDYMSSSSDMCEADSPDTYNALKTESVSTPLSECSQEEYDLIDSQARVDILKAITAASLTSVEIQPVHSDWDIKQEDVYDSISCDAVPQTIVNRMQTPALSRASSSDSNYCSAPSSMLATPRLSTDLFDDPPLLFDTSLSYQPATSLTCQQDLSTQSSWFNDAPDYFGMDASLPLGAVVDKMS